MKHIVKYLTDKIEAIKKKLIRAKRKNNRVKINKLEQQLIAAEQKIDRVRGLVK